MGFFKQEDLFMISLLFCWKWWTAWTVVLLFWLKLVEYVGNPHVCLLFCLPLWVQVWFSVEFPSPVNIEQPYVRVQDWTETVQLKSLTVNIDLLW